MLLANGLGLWWMPSCKVVPGSFVRELVGNWVKIPIWSDFQITRQLQPQTKFRTDTIRLVFLQPQPHPAAQGSFLKSLLSPAAHALFWDIPESQSFWSSPPMRLT